VRTAAVVIGVLLIVVGTVWAIQGYGALKGSFMTGSRTWLWIGIACAGAGIVVLVTSFLANRR
jgi:hypothetical protein